MHVCGGVQCLYITCSLPCLLRQCLIAPGGHWLVGQAATGILYSFLPILPFHVSTAMPSSSCGAGPHACPAGPGSQVPSLQNIFLFGFTGTCSWNSTKTALEWLCYLLVWLHGDQWTLWGRIFFSEQPQQTLPLWQGKPRRAQVGFVHGNWPSGHSVTLVIFLFP